MTLHRPPSPCVTIEVRSPHATEGFDAVAILPTFRRPGELLRTLASLAAQATRRRLAVIVMENDAEGREGLEAARSLFETGAMAGLVLIAHDRGNCSAYNAGFETALSEFPGMRHCLVIDDDETAGPDWTERMIDTVEALGVDVAGAPQTPVFEGRAGNAIARHPVFRPPFARTGQVPILYSSGNLCLTRALLERMGAPFFDTAFNFTGGGDSDFFSRAARQGARFGWCAEAPVCEIVPARRTQWSWINARSLRNGALSSAIQQRRDGRLHSAVKTAALLVAAPPRAVFHAIAQRSLLIGLYPIQVALGRLQGEFGRIGEQYRKPEAN